MIKRHRKKKKIKTPSVKWIFLRGAFFCLFLGLIYFFFFTSVWDIQGIKIEPVGELVYLQPLQIEEKIEKGLEARKIYRLFGIGQFLSPKNIFLIPTQSLKEMLLENFPEIGTVSLRKNFRPLQLEVKIKERERIGVWCAVEYRPVKENKEAVATSTEEEISVNQNERVIKECFYLDKTGVIYRPAPLIKGGLVLNIYSQPAKHYQIRERVVPLEIIDFILAIKKGLPEIKFTSDFSLETVDFEIISQEDLKVTTNLGWQIYFNPVYSPQKQLKALEAVLKEEVKEAYRSLEYLDLRIEGRVYYK